MKGRVAIYEVMPVGEGLREPDPAPRSLAAELRDLALREGMKTLRQNAISQKVVEGVTTIEEVLRVTIG